MIFSIAFPRPCRDLLADNVKAFEGCARLFRPTYAEANVGHPSKGERSVSGEIRPGKNSVQGEKSFQRRTVLTNAQEGKLQQLRNLLQLIRNVSDADSAMMCRTVRIPALDEFARAQREAIPAVGVSNSKV